MMTFWGLMKPLIGTTAGSACVFFLKGKIRPSLQKALLGFASGVMIAASVWSLLMPSIEMSQNMGGLAFLPAAAGVLVGVFFLLILDRSIPHLHLGAKSPEGPKREDEKGDHAGAGEDTLHNIPEGMAVGVIFAGALSSSSEITMAGALTLAVGIAIQNFPEGAIISMPFKERRRSEPGKSLSLRNAFGSRGAGGSSDHHCAGRAGNADSSLSSGICRRRDDLCGGGRADTGSQPGNPQQHWNHRFCRGVCHHDGSGCGPRIKHPF